MNINIAEVVEDQKKMLELNIEEKIDKISYLGDEVVFIKPVTFDGNIIKQNGEILLKGIVQGIAKFFCYRCLKEFEQKISSNIFEKLINAKDSDPALEDDFYAIDNNMINITEIIEDALILSLPMKIICNEGCKGLCPICGTDLNLNTCTCNDNKIDPRLAKLKDLLQQD